MSSETAMSADLKITGTQIEIPEILVLEGFGYSVPGPSDDTDTEVAPRHAALGRA